MVQQKCQSDGFKNACAIEKINFVPYATGKINNGHHVPCMNNDNNIKNACAIDRINFVPCGTEKINNGHHVPCANNNIKCDIHDPPTINYDIITLSKNNHQEHQVQPSPISNKPNVTTPSKLARTQELLFKEASNMEELMNNAIEMKQILYDTSTTGTLPLDKIGNKALISVMISSMKQIVDRSKPTSSSSNDILTHNTHDVRQYKYASNLNNSKWAIKALKTKTDVNLRRTSVPEEFSAPHIHRESYIPFASSKRKYDTMIVNNELPLTTSLNGELERF